MALEFDGTKYRTIQDIKDKYKVSEKSLRKWSSNGDLPSPEMIYHGGRTFRHYSDEWCSNFEQFLASKRSIAS